jgi:hypothetical protein
MPAIAEIQVVPGVDSLNVAVSWKLDDDPERPNKMSRTISICVSREAAEDFASASAADQRGAFSRVVAFLSAKLSTFDPKHNVPKYGGPPVEQWVISTEVVLG